MRKIHFVSEKSKLSSGEPTLHEDIQEDEEILDLARMLREHGIKKIDSLHLACAIRGKADFFLTTDDGILKKTALIQTVQITDPIGFIKEVLV